MFIIVRICDKDTLDVLGKFLAIFYVSNKVNFQIYFANKPIEYFVFWSVQKTLAACVLSNLKHSAIASCF